MTEGPITDFFQSAPAGAAEKPSQTSATKPAPRLQFLRNTCDCGAGGGWKEVSHYEIVRCNCGENFWALQPKRNGPYLAKIWPGLPGMEASR